MKHIIFVEDDLSLINGLSFAIRKQGYEIDIVQTTLEAETLWATEKYELVILDVSLPDGSGFDLCTKIRKASKISIMFFNAADEEIDIIMGLDIGGDDINELGKLVIVFDKYEIALGSMGEVIFEIER